MLYRVAVSFSSSSITLARIVHCFLFTAILTGGAQADDVQFDYATNVANGIGSGIALDLSGSTYIVHGNRVAKLDSNGNLVWVKSITGSGRANGNGIAVDGSNNVYNVGVFSRTMDFDPGPGFANRTTLGADTFVQKLDPDGILLWAKTTAGTASCEASAVAVDPLGNVYATGYFAGKVDFDPGGGTTNLTSSGDFDVFLQKLDSAGDFLWAKKMGGTGRGERANAVAVDTSGNVYIAGSFDGAMSFTSNEGTVELVGAGSSDIYVQKLDSDGNFLWAKAMGGTHDDRGYGIASDASGNVYTTGYFGTTADFDPGAGVANLTCLGHHDIFVQKLDSSGDFVWAKAMRGYANYEHGRAITIGDSGNVYITGYFEGTVDFDPGSGTYELVSSGGDDVFVQKLNSGGNFLWAKAMGGTDYDNGYSIAVDASGNVYTTGEFEGTADFDPGEPTTNLTSTLGTSNVFLSKLAFVDTTPPTADTIAPAPAGPTNASTVEFTVKFSEDVTNFDSVTDVLITHTGTAHTGVGITGNDDTYTVSVTGVSGDGSFTLAVNTGSDVEDTTGNALTTSVTSAAVVIDNTAPVITLVDDNEVFITEDDTYTDAGATAVDNIDDDITGQIGTISTVNDSVPGDYMVSYSVTDTAGNAATTVIRTVTVIAVPPEVVSVVPIATGPTNATSVDFEVVFSEAVSNFDSATDVAVNHSGTTHTGINVTGAGDTYTVSVTGISGNGLFTLAVVTNSDIQDAAGNALATGATSASVAIDNTAPVIILNDDSLVVVKESSIYTDAGATAIDNIDGDISDVIVTTNPVNTDVVGEYEVVYNVSDAAGNAANPVNRTVLVRRRADIDGDGSVNIIDLQYVVNAILELPLPDDIDTDVNGDGKTNVLDLFEVVDVILEG